MASSSEIIRVPEDVDTQWLSAVLGAPISSFGLTRIGTGQVSEAYRLDLGYGETVKDMPGSLVMKIAARNQTSRTSAKKLKLYQREVAFYTRCAPLLPDVVAKCWFAKYDEPTESFCLLLEDCAPAKYIDDISGVGLDDALLALNCLGKLHSVMHAFADDLAFSWISRESQINQDGLSQLFMAYQARFRERLSAEHLSVCERLVSNFDGYSQREDAEIICGPLHGDYRADNLLFGAPEALRRLTVVDWQTTTYGSLLGEFGYFLGSIDTSIRRQNFEQLLIAYHDGLGQAFFGVVMGIASPMLVEQTARGDAMFVTTMARHCASALDIGAFDLLAKPHVALHIPLAPDVSDEDVHDPTHEELWNESYYFDFIDPQQDVAGWIRLGITPNIGVNNFTAMISRRQQPLVALTDYNAPHVGPDRRVKSKNYTASLTIIEPLKRFNVSLETTNAEVFADESAPLKAVPTAAGNISLRLNLSWTTTGQPYRYRITSRYEIPCLVSGTVDIGDYLYEMTNFPGQRDHSWGVRDWWSMTWMWATIHVSDEHYHTLDLRIPGRPSMGMGYFQDQGQVSELELLAVTGS